MCGIVGIVGSPQTRVRDPLRAALKALASRGPDGTGRARADLGAWPVHFGVRRLALVDSRARQPVATAQGGVLVLNGEIYNHEALRRELDATGELVLPGLGDAGVLAALLERDGLRGLARVEGSYAFAWLERPEGPLILARDPLGVRPLVFAAPPEGLVFASTLDALLATGMIAPEPDLDALVDVLRDGVIPTRRTALRGVRRVAPGEIVRLDRNLRIQSEAMPRHPVPSGEDDGDVLGALRTAVTSRLQTSRGAAIFLSGGVDSALVAALAREAGEFPAYTLTFPGQAAVDERRRARQTARRLGLAHVEVPCPSDPTSWIHATAAAFDEPFADASAVPTWGVALAAARNVHVALTGTGGDEVFGGYRRYWLLGAGPWLRHVPSFVREPLTQVFDRNLPVGARMLRASADPQGLYRGLLRLYPPSDLEGLLGPSLADAAFPAPGEGPRTAGEAMADDLVTYLPDDLLVKEDRALMAHGIEGRHPFLDGRVRRAARALEIQGGVGRGHQKQVLRAFVKEVIDPDLARAPKRGFAFPVDALYRGVLQPLAEDVLTSRSMRERGFVSPHGAMRVLRDHLRGIRDLGPVIHALVMLELWAKRTLDVPRAGSR